MTKIKLCGLRRPEDVAMVNRAMPDFAGFVFAKGKRQVTPMAARTLRSLLDPQIRAVGVFVKAPVEEVAALVSEGTIQCIQLHGDEDGDYIRQLRWRTKAPLIKVLRVKDEESLKDLDTWDCDYFLLDTFAGSQFAEGSWDVSLVVFLATGAVAGLCVIFQDRILAGIAALKGKFSLEKHGDL